MASDWTEIANQALVMIGAETIADLDEGSPDADDVKAVIFPIRDQVLRLHPWNCAEEIEQLAANPTQAAFGFSNSYQLPTDPYCLRALKIEGTEAFAVRGRKLFTNAKSPVQLTYIGRIEDPTRLDVLCADTIALLIAARIAYKKVQSRTLAADLYAQFKDMLSDARSIDAQESRVEDPRRSRYVATHRSV